MSGVCKIFPPSDPASRATPVCVCSLDFAAFDGLASSLGSLRDAAQFTFRVFLVLSAPALPSISLSTLRLPLSFSPSRLLNLASSTPPRSIRTSHRKSPLSGRSWDSTCIRYACRASGLIQSFTETHVAGPVHFPFSPARPRTLLFSRARPGPGRLCVPSADTRRRFPNKSCVFPQIGEPMSRPTAERPSTPPPVLHLAGGAPFINARTISLDLLLDKRTGHRLKVGVRDRAQSPDPTSNNGRYGLPKRLAPNPLLAGGRY